MIYLSILVFFVTFFRISFLNANFYLLLIPSLLGILLIITKLQKNHQFKVQKNSQTLILVYFMLFIYVLGLDFFQRNLSLSSSFTFRMLTIIFFSLIPAYYLNYKFIKNDSYILKDTIKYSFIIQVAFFIITFTSSNIKVALYNLMGVSDSVNLIDYNLNARGFGFSGEINFLTPSLMAICMLLFFRNKIFQLLIIITQLINSNLTLVSTAITFIFAKGKSLEKLFSLALVFILYTFVGLDFIELYFPRFYAEYIISGGQRTTEGLLDEHTFIVGRLDISTLLFGFQENVSSAVSNQGRFSDVGWVIMFNYGGLILCVLFTLFIITLSNLIFKDFKLKLLWIVLAILFNMKGMIMGFNGYFFLSFLFLFSNYFNSKGVK